MSAQSAFFDAFTQAMPVHSRDSRPVQKSTKDDCYPFNNLLTFDKAKYDRILSDRDKILKETAHGQPIGKNPDF
jgi:hypothetical protein